MPVPGHAPSSVKHSSDAEAHDDDSVDEEEVDRAQVALPGRAAYHAADHAADQEPEHVAERGHKAPPPMINQMPGIGVSVTCLPAEEAVSSGSVVI